MATNAFSSLATIRLHLPARLVPNSCCPDKDLIVLFSRLGGTDRMSLWNSNQGSRIWEVDVGEGDNQATGIAWSPDGQTIAIMQHPPAVSLHSLQNGRSFLTLELESNSEQSTEETNPHLSGVWWFYHEIKSQTKGNIPDIFKRNDIITGSVHSLLKLLPLLDNLQEDADKLTATDLFAFQGSLTLKSHKATLPEVIAEWPTLSADLAAASIGAPCGKLTSDNTHLDDADKSNLNSILLVVDNTGHLFTYLDGTFPLGSIPIGKDTTISCLLKHAQRPMFIGSSHVVRSGQPLTSLRPIRIEIPLLAQRKPRDLAKMSSTARELAWHVLRVGKDMRDAWFGTESNTGARVLGPRWVQQLRAKQKEEFGEEDVNPILDLTSLLTTGRSSDSLSDFLGSGEQMSERGMQKWESTVTDALIKLRDSSEKRVAPALQRLHLVLEEILGWSKLPQFSLFDLSTAEISKCLDLASNGIVIANWLAAASRTELSRFREFISWLRFEVNNINNVETNVPRHDLLEVNSYFISGLVTSQLDKWFIGPCPLFKSSDLGVLDYNHATLNEALDYAFKIASDPAELAWQTAAPKQDISNLDRNLEALVQELTSCCGRVFHHAAGAASRAAVVSSDPVLGKEPTPAEIQSSEHLNFPVREHAVLSEANEFLQYLAFHIPSNDSNNMMLLCKLRFGIETPEVPSEIDVALLECYLPEEEDEVTTNLELLDADFFDDECVVIVYRLQNKQSFIATFNYTDIAYQNLQQVDFVRASTRQDLMQDALESWKNGQISVVKNAIMRRRALLGCKGGGVSLSLNGRVGRRVACVLDSAGTLLETFDMEGDAEDLEVLDDTRAG